MRALCGAIVTAGALVGLGLTALAYGIRFQNFGPEALNTESKQLYGLPSLTVILVVLLLATLIGLGIAFWDWPSTTSAGTENDYASSARREHSGLMN